MKDLKNTEGAAGTCARISVGVCFPLLQSWRGDVNDLHFSFIHLFIEEERRFTPVGVCLGRAPVSLAIALAHSTRMCCLNVNPEGLTDRDTRTSYKRDRI